LNEQLDNVDAHTIHIWNASLSVSPNDVDRYQSVLSADECKRAARFHFDVHRSRFVAGRGILRRLLSRYTGQDPVAIQFRYASNGKPSLRECDLHFNLSHSENRVVFAFTGVAAVGVDVERVRLMPDMTQIAENLFSPVEFQAISAIPDKQRNQAFYRCWTRKEAIIKAIGKGLGHPLDGFDVSLEAMTQVVLVNGSNADSRRFFVYDLGLSDGYIGAVACARRCDRIAVFQYDSLAE
jgi:4'-phosphopantetheinyl transferase